MAQWKPQKAIRDRIQGSWRRIKWDGKGIKTTFRKSLPEGGLCKEVMPKRSVFLTDWNVFVESDLAIFKNISSFHTVALQYYWLGNTRSIIMYVSKKHCGLIDQLWEVPWFLDKKHIIKPFPFLVTIAIFKSIIY